MKPEKTNIIAASDKMRTVVDEYMARMGDERRYNVQLDADEATIYLYDVIGNYWGDGISAKQFAADLSGITAGTIHLRINSPGGDVFDARAMQTALAQHPARIIAHIDGLAASASTYVMLGADEVEAVDGAMFMIHNAWALTIGNKNEMRAMGDTLDKIDQGIAADYMRKTGASAEQVSDWMDAETDFTAAEALEYGFIDRIYKPEKATKREAEKALRDAGFTASDSKKILAGGYGALASRDAEPDKPIDTAAVAAALRRSIETLQRNNAI